MEQLLRLFLQLTGAFLFFLLLTSWWGFYTSIRPPKITSDITPKDFGQENLFHGQLGEEYKQKIYSFFQRNL